MKFSKICQITRKLQHFWSKYRPIPAHFLESTTNKVHIIQAYWAISHQKYGLMGYFSGPVWPSLATCRLASAAGFGAGESL
jgi:hypothetical protein